MRQRSEKWSQGFAEQALLTCAPFLSKPLLEMDVLDIGSGYGHTALALAQKVRRVVGVEPAPGLVAEAKAELVARKVANVEFVHGAIEEFESEEKFDLVILDNVYEHLPDQEKAMRRIVSVMRPGSVLYILTPNKLWPIEVHYRLPFLSYLPIRLANAYLRLTGRGTDYTDASFAPTYNGVRRMFARFPELKWQFALPARVDLAQGGKRLSYRLGVAARRRSS